MVASLWALAVVVAYAWTHREMYVSALRVLVGIEP